MDIDCTDRPSREVGEEDGYQAALDAEQEAYRDGEGIAGAIERVRDLCSCPTAWDEAAINAGVKVLDWSEYNRGAQAGAERRLAELESE